MPDDLPGANASARGWRATLIGVCIAQAAAIVGFDFTLPFVPLYLQHDLGVHGLGETALWAGLIGFGPAIPAAIFGPIWGSVADKYGYRLMLLRAMICAAVLLALMGLAPTPAILLALRMVQGALSGTVYSSQALVAATVPEKEAGRSMGLLQMSISVGATLGPIAGGLMAQTLGYRAAFVGAGAIMGVAAMVVLFYVREPARHAVERPSEEKSSVRSVLAVKPFVVAVLLTLAVQLCATAYFPLIPLFVQELLHSAQQVASDTGWIFAVSGLTSAAGAYLAGRLQRRIGLYPLLIGAMGLSAVLLLPQSIAGSFVAFLLLRAATAFAFGALFSLVGIWAALTSPPSARGTAFGLLGAASSLGFGGGPLLGGAVAAMVGIRPVFALSAIMLGGVCLTVGLMVISTPILRSVQPQAQRS